MKILPPQPSICKYFDPQSNREFFLKKVLPFPVPLPWTFDWQSWATAYQHHILYQRSSIYDGTQSNISISWHVIWFYFYFQKGNITIHFLLLQSSDAYWVFRDMLQNNPLHCNQYCFYQQALFEKVQYSLPLVAMILIFLKKRM